MKKILVTGGAGYIGSTVCSALLDHGFLPIILDDLSAGPRQFTSERVFYEGDISDSHLLTKVFNEHEIFAVIHCAAKIVVPESVSRPDFYYSENVVKSIRLFSELKRLGCKRIVFSSSAAVYDVVANFMVTEDSPLKPQSPYARTKFMMEMILEDMCAAYDMKAIALRYFNPIGADPKLRTGSYVKAPTHVLGKMLTSHKDQNSDFIITGADWPTRDGTGIRDYIHVWDLAMAHVASVEKFDEVFGESNVTDLKSKGFMVINLGTGNGVTVRELVLAFEQAAGKKLNAKVTSRRPGDVAGSYANCSRAFKVLGWKSKLDIQEGIQSSLEWIQKFFG
ncbi:MAG: UDP-glucose 4-epimerase GalE [Proteobacteria bacterium]|nr:UDP-glucose 4-epimerase GalE [Pseudomonadota bacterium]